MPAALKDLRKAPWTLWAIVGVDLTYEIVARIEPIPTTHPLSVGLKWGLAAFGALFTLALWFFLLRGSRVVWWFLVLVSVGNLVTTIITRRPWYWWPQSPIELALFLAPPSRRYVFRSRPGVWYPGDGDPTRERGWYLDPDNPRRMRYWDAERGGWHSKTLHASRRRRSSSLAVRPPPTTWDPHADDDETRAPGWYQEPADPTRMRYWDPELGGWQGKTIRAPRRLGRATRD